MALTLEMKILRKREMSEKEARRRERIVKVLDEEAAWTHVVMWHLSSAGGGVRRRKNGWPDERDNMGRLMVKLWNAIDRVVFIDKSVDPIDLGS